MPLFGLKLLSVIVERNSAFIVILNKLQLVDLLFQYFEVNHQKFNSFTVKIVRAIIQSREIDLASLVKMGIVNKMNGILANVMKNNQEWCSDHLLEIINELLHMASDSMNKDGKEAQADAGTPQMIYDSFMVNFPHFFTLLGASDVTIVDKAAQNILAFIHFSMIAGIQKNDTLKIRDKDLALMLPAFKNEKTSICKNLIKSIYWAMSLAKNPLRPSHDMTKQILKISEKLLASEDKSLTNTAREVVKLCKNVLAN